MARPPITIPELDEVRADLRKARRDLPKAVGDANKELGETVIRDSRPRADNATARKAFERGAIKSSRRARSAVLVLDGMKFGGAIGSETGSIRYPQFPAYAGGDVFDGYTIGATLDANLDRYGEEYLDGLYDAIAKRAFTD